ncbi:MAG: hypothetical protein L0G99_13035 [Propionibacteriales bacterium]|nr:hypothetical protein [Propionibacteriales bacterium]
MEMTADGGGGTPTVTSNVTVDPGQIAQFAKFLDDMQGDLKIVHSMVTAVEDIKPDDFGIYNGSVTAHTKYMDTVKAEASNVQDLVRRTNDAITGTTNVAKAYNDLDELNRANGAAITSHMRATAPNA